MRVLPLLALAACTGQSADDETPTCDLTATVTFPEDGDVFPGGPFEVTLSDSDPDAAFTDGLTYARGGNTVGVWFDPPLAPDADVTLTLETCAGTQTFDVHTAAVGASLGDVDLTTLAWDADLSAMTFIRPAAGNIASLLGGGLRVLVGATSHAGDDVAIRVALADADGNQDMCSRTLDIDGVTVDRGFLVLPASNVTFPVEGAVLDLVDLRVTLALSDDGGAITGGSISTFVRVQGMADLWAGGDLDQACDFFGALQAPCVDCPDEGRCLVLEATDMAGTGGAGGLASVTETCPE